MKKWTLALALTLTLSFGLVMPTFASHSENNSTTLIDIYKSLTLFGEIFNQINRNHVDEQEVQELIDAAIEGMIKTLDKHSSYLRPKDFKDMQDSTKGEYFGIGAEVSWDDEKKGVRILAPMVGSPAIRDGLKANDLIIEIDGTILIDFDIQKAIEVIKGPTGSKVTFKVIRDNETEPLMITVTRGKIEQKVVKFRIISDDIMYIKLSQFNENGADEIRDAVIAMKETNTVFGGLILDLRYNPGGLLTQAIEITDMFLDEGLIIEIRPRNVNAGEKTFAVVGQIIASDMELVILINEYSASASEIIAGTLQYLHRATLIGIKSYGKGSVQTIMPLNNGGALRLTIAKYYTAEGTSPHGVGISPDIEVILPENYWDDVEPENISTHIDPQIQRAIDYIDNVSSELTFPNCNDSQTVC